MEVFMERMETTRKIKLCLPKGLSPSGFRIKSLVCPHTIIDPFS